MSVIVCMHSFIASNKARSMSYLSKDERKHQVAAQYAEMFNCQEMANVCIEYLYNY